MITYAKVIVSAEAQETVGKVVVETLRKNCSQANMDCEDKQAIDGIIITHGIPHQ